MIYLQGHALKLSELIFLFGLKHIKIKYKTNLSHLNEVWWKCSSELIINSRQPSTRLGAYRNEDFTRFENFALENFALFVPSRRVRGWAEGDALVCTMGTRSYRCGFIRGFPGQYNSLR